MRFSTTYHRWELMKSKLGAIFPILPENVERLFDQKQTVFVKYTKFKELERGSKIVFYVSKEKKLIGEGTVERVEKANPKTAWAHYGRRIFLNETEYNQYVSKSPVDGRNRKTVEITLFILKKLKKYRNPVQWTYSITPSGFYITREKYKELRLT